MKAALVFIAVTSVLSLGACKDRQEATQAEISKGNPEGQQLRKKYEEAGKQADERRKAD